jgi:hypothetical protein
MRGLLCYIDDMTRKGGSMNVVLDYAYPKVKINRLVDLLPKDEFGEEQFPPKFEARIAISEVQRALNAWHYEAQ